MLILKLFDGEGVRVTGEATIYVERLRNQTRVVIDAKPETEIWRTGADGKRIVNPKRPKAEPC